MTTVAPRASAFVGTCTVPPDKSISHRAAIVAALARGTSRIAGYATARDCASTLSALEALGISVRRDADAVTVEGPFGVRADGATADCGRAGTAMRLLAGALAALPITTTLTGDDQLLRRPMERVAAPLRSMGADVRLADGGRAPIRVRGGGLHGITYAPPVTSAQVKSAVLLAGLGAEGPTIVEEPVASRDHTERLLAAAGVDVVCDGPRAEPGRIRIEPGRVEPFELAVPGDLSSAAFVLAAAALVPGSDVTVERVGLNPTRTAFVGVLERMGARVEVEPTDEEGVEPSGWIRVRSSPLRATTVTADEVPVLIDELPLVALLATRAEGVTEVRGAAELRVKESDRIAGVVRGLRALGADVQELPDGFVVSGPTSLHGGSPDACGDHRLAMLFWVAGSVASGPVHVGDITFADDSFPGFGSTMTRLAGAG